MIKIGREYICDRCGSTEFISVGSGNLTRGIPNGYEDLGGAEEREVKYPEYWEQIFGMDLCRECAKDFRKWLNFKTTRA